jgi:hypothetical protein
MSKITFTRESLDRYKSEYDKAIENNHTTFVWKNSLNNVYDAKKLIDN